MDTDNVGATIGRPKRKKNRLDNYDYSSCGAYFITISTVEKRNYFWSNVGATIRRPQDIELSPYGQIVNEAINNIPTIYPSISIEQYVIMPDHIHALIFLHEKTGGASPSPTCFCRSILKNKS